MAIKTLDHGTLQHLVEAGAVQRAHVMAGQVAGP